MPDTLTSHLNQFLLFRDLKPDTAAWYRRIVSVYCGWAGCDVPLCDFCGSGISQLLQAKQAAGRSPSYVKSLRNGLVALLRELRGNDPIERVRGVKVPNPEPAAWSAAEVERLIAVCDSLPKVDRWHWRTLIAAAYYTGLDRCDLERIERRNILAGGVLPFRRGKTDKPVVVAIPADLLAEIDRRCPAAGPIWPRRTSKEWFRRRFARLVKLAGLVGTFKTLRKSSGTGVDIVAPGHGHEHLGNTRAIFERHYRARALVPHKPTMPPRVRLG